MKYINRESIYDYRDAFLIILENEKNILDDMDRLIYIRDRLMKI